MKPIQLTMTAFGPYKNREVINFDELEDNRLFVISGKTGAGKTTIFDGICFALYGSASGEDRQDPKLMRSHFADDDVHTSVELVFELHGSKYRVLRQLGHVKKGNKSATGEKYEFYKIEENGEVPCVDRQIVSDINQKMEELIGLTKDQFSQIVMLPQGEFRKLLTSKTENKEEILRRIFQTYPYLEISDKLKEKKKLAEDAFELFKQERDRYIQDIYAKLPVREESVLFQTLEQDYFNMNQIVKGLELEAEYYAKHIFEVEHAKDEANRRRRQIEETYHKAKTLNEKFAELEQLDSKLELLNSQKQSFKEQEEILEKAERASHIDVYARHVIDWRLDVENKKESKKLSVQALTEAENSLQQAEIHFSTEEKRKAEREKATRQVNQLEELLPKVRELNVKKEEVNNLEIKVIELNRELEGMNESINSLLTNKEEIAKKIKQYTKEVEKLPDEEKKLNTMREQAKELKGYLKLQDALLKLKEQYTAAEKSFKEIKNHYVKKEEAWFKGQASILAAHLHDGEHCPVCGSVEHPDKAKLNEETPNKEELDKLKAELDEKEQTFKDIIAKGKTIKEQLLEKEEVIKDFGIVPKDVKQTFDQLSKEGQSQKVKVETIVEQRKALNNIQQTYEQLEKELTDKQKENEELQKKYYDFDSKYKSSKAVYDELLKNVPVDVRDVNLLTKKIDEVKKLKRSLEQAWEQAQKDLQEKKNFYINAKANVEHAEQQLEEAHEKLSKSESQFLEQLHQASFNNEKEYKLAKRTEEERHQLKTSIDYYKKDVHATEERMKQLNDQLNGKERVDIQSLEQKLKEAENHYEKALEKYNAVQQQNKDVLDIKSRIELASEKVHEQEQQLNRITDLYDIIRGQNNLKISFERYLQIEYLEQIVEAANERLKRLSNGQFYLKRSERQEARGRQSGLGLDVYDVYTGQDRDVKSLSGGEKFNASLSLALGMSDVIQSFQGGVSIDTMFIDEGFGSLDDESLNKAVDTLIDLQKSGRMIGVISHVQELKASIPAILEVNKTKEGYSRTQFVLK